MATAQNTLSIVSANTAKQAAAKKAAAKKAAAKKAAAPTTWDSAIVSRIASGVVAVAKAEELREKLAADIKEFRTYKVKLGASRRTCGISQEFFAAFMALGVKEKTATNYLSCLRESINNGKPFSLNQSRDSAKGKGKTTPRARKGTPANAYKDAGTVLDALATAIQNVKSKAGTSLWEKALTMAPDGFDLAVADFLEAQGETE